MAGPLVLIVDDDIDLREMMGEVCSQLGCQTATVGSGKEALEAMKRKKFSLVISDIRMPDMDGMALLKAAESLCLAIPVILMTGFSDYTEQQVDDANGVGYLEKPFTRAQLREIIEKYLAVL